MICGGIRGSWHSYTQFEIKKILKDCFARYYGFPWGTIPKQLNTPILLETVN